MRAMATVPLTPEEEGWVAAAAAAAAGGINLTAVPLNNESMLNKVFIALDITEIAPQSRLCSLIGKLQQQPNVSRRNILGAGVAEKLKLSVFYFIDKARKPIGTGFFVSSNIAVSSAHTFSKTTKVGAKRTGYFGRPNEGKKCQLIVDFIDWENDFIVFVAQSGHQSPSYLTPTSESLQLGDECILVAYQIGLHNDLEELGKEPTAGVFLGAITKRHERHFVYSCPSFAGDSGGAIILHDGEVFGIHIMTVNEANELQRLKSLETGADDEDNLDMKMKELTKHVISVEKSVNSLVDSLNSGALGLSISAIMAAYESQKT